MTLYAQYAYPLRLDNIEPFVTLSLGDTPLGDPAIPYALPDIGTATIYVEKGDGDWIANDTGFTGSVEGKTIELEFVFVGAEAEFTVDEDGSGVVTFTYSGPVTLSMTCLEELL